MSSLSFLVLLPELLQSLGYTMVSAPSLWSIAHECWTITVGNACQKLALLKQAVQLSQKNISASCSSIWYTNGSLCTDAFMDFTSGILSVTGINATGHIFASYPARHLSILGGFIDQVSSPWPNDLPSIVHRCSHSGSKHCEFWQMQLMQYWLPQLVWERPFICSVFGSNDPFPAIHWSVKSILNTIFRRLFSLFCLCSDPKITRLLASNCWKPGGPIREISNASFLCNGGTVQVWGP